MMALTEVSAGATRLLQAVFGLSVSGGLEARKFGEEGARGGDEGPF
jgi:hypothetical protein